MKGRKSLGVLRHPIIEVRAFNGGRGMVELAIFTENKLIRLEVRSYGVARRLADCAREIAGKHRDYAKWERRSYLDLKKYTGYVPEDGEE